MESESSWHKCQVISRAGKATGKDKYFFNILDLSNTSLKDINWKTVKEWRYSSEPENIFLTEKAVDENILVAKISEINKWKDNNVFEPEQ